MRTTSMRKLKVQRRISLPRTKLFAGSAEGGSDGDPASAKLNEELKEIAKKTSATVGVGKLAGNTTLIDREIYSGLKDKVLDTPDSLSRFTAEKKEVGPGAVEGGEVEDGKAQEEEQGNAPLPGAPRMVTAPDPKYTPSEVVIAVLDALQNNNSPDTNHGISVLFAFTSPASASVGSDISDFASYIPTSKYKILLNWDERMFEKKISYSADKKKAYLDVKIRDKDTREWDVVSWVLSSRAQQGRLGGEVWLVDSMLVRGPKRGY